MKIQITHDRITVPRYWAPTFTATASDITRLAVKGDYKHLERHKTFLRSLFIEAGEIDYTDWKPLHFFLGIGTQEKAITLDSEKDVGFDAAVNWFKENGWEIDKAIEEALRTPLIRIYVSRSEHLSGSDTKLPSPAS